jgi:hypothetical protein
MLRGPLAAAVGFLLGCGPALPYRPGFLIEEPVVQPGKPPGAAAARQVGCLDVRAALACNAAVPADLPLVAFTLGNRCDSAAVVDFTRLVVTGRTAAPEDASATLAPFDPGHEIHPAVLGPRAMAREVIEYDASPREATRAIAELCIDLSGLSGAEERPAPLCLARPEGACAR